MTWRAAKNFQSLELSVRKYSNHWKFTLALSAAVFSIKSFAASPDLNAVVPAGGQRGSTCDVELRGERLQAPQQILFYEPGIEATSLSFTNNVVKASLKIAPDCELGEHKFRLRTASGISDLGIFRVGPFPNVDEVEPNSDFSAPQKVPLNSTVNGVVKSEDVDYFVVEAKKGQRISAEVEAMRLGQKLFDSSIAILDTNRFELAASDDTPLFKQDGIASAIAPYDGSYIVMIRESSYGGSDSSRYRLHIGSFSRPLVVFPSGGKAGETVALRFIGDVTGDIVVTQQIPAASGTIPIFASGSTEPPPSGNPFRVCDFPNVNKTGPSDAMTNATRSPFPPPIAFNGILENDSDKDWFAFPTKKDQSYDVRVFARDLGSPIDAVITVRGPKRQQLGNNDDNEKRMDSYVQFKSPDDGDCEIQIRDQLKQGGSNYVYRIEVTPSKQAITMRVPEFLKDTQVRHTVPVPRGNRNAVLLAVKKENIGGDMTIESSGLPDGVKMEVPPLIDGIDQVPVVFEAATGAQFNGALTKWSARPADANQATRGIFDQFVELVYGEPNQTVYFGTDVDRIAVGVTDESPFSLEVEPMKAPLVRAGQMRLGVIVHRKPGFDEAIKIRLVWSPPGVNAPAELSIEKGADRGEIRLDANGDAQTRVWKTAVIGAASVGGGDLWVSSPFFDLPVETPYVGGKLGMMSVEKGQAVDFVCELSQLKPFEGKARLGLYGLPARCSVAPVEFTKDDKTVTFHITTEEKSPVGQHKDLFCSAEIPVNGATVVQTVCGGGTLRVDAPKKKDVEVAKAFAPPPAEKPKEPERVLSPLEKLRQSKKAAGT